MELNLCEKCILNHIYLNQPSSVDLVASTEDFARSLGHCFANDDIMEALLSLRSRNIIIEITFEVARAILSDLEGVHGPLLPIDTVPHYSLTISGGNLYRQIYPQSAVPSGGCTVPLIEHTQFFSPSALTIQQLAKDFRGTKVASVIGAYLAPNNEVADGYVTDLLVSPTAKVHPIQVQHNHTILLRQYLELCTRKKPILHDSNSICSDIMMLLIRFSGFLGYFPVAQHEITPLLAAGFTSVLSKDDAATIRQTLATNQAIMFGPYPQSGQCALSTTGRDVVVSLLHAMPDANNHLLASRLVGEYKQHYFSSWDQAAAYSRSLHESGKLVTSIERLGRWCYYWWDVQKEGVRFSSWSVEPYAPGGSRP